MPEPVNASSALVRAARALARTGELEATLRAIGGQAGVLAGDAGTAILIHDAETALLSTPDGALTVPAADGTAPVLAEAILDRRPRWSAETNTELAALTPGAPRQAILPLVVEDILGAGVEGILLIGTGSAGPAEAVREEIGAIADLAAVAIRVARLHNVIAEEGDYLERLARTDPLTGLVDRRTFDQVLELEVVRATRQKTALAVVLADVDALGAINAEHGADVGDDILRRVAAGISGLIRLIDTVARIESDTIGVIAPGDALGVVGRRIRETVEAIPAIGGARASVSIGIAHHPEDGTTGAELVAAARAALAAAKERGPGSIAGSREEP